MSAFVRAQKAIRCEGLLLVLVLRMTRASGGSRDPLRMDFLANPRE
jgi:hypothetical protein